MKEEESVEKEQRPYLKCEYDFQMIQLDGLGIPRDQLFEQRINCAIAMAYENKSEQSKIEEAILWCDERLRLAENEERFTLEQVKEKLLSLSTKKEGEKEDKKV